jgi:hypothetical protein
VEIVSVEELKRAPTIGLDRGRTPDKQEKDRQHLSRRQQISQVFKDAYHDNVDSLGEVDVDTEHDYPSLKLTSGDVLRDPKLRYSDPFLGDGSRTQPDSHSEQLRKFGIEQGWAPKR